MRQLLDLSYTQAIRRFKQSFGIIAITGLTLAFIGPYGSYHEMSLFRRLIYWEGIVCLNAWQIYFGIALFQHYFKEQSVSMRTAILGCLLASIPAFIEVFILEGTLRDPAPPIPSLAGFLVLYVDVLVLTVALGLAFHWASSYLLEKNQSLPAQQATNFHQRIPTKIQGELLAITAEDHYLRIYTDAGSDLVLMRMGDAVNELEGEGGMRVHRSHWVASHSITGHRRDKDRVLLKLKNGLEIPVSRAYLKQVRAAGWLG